MPRSFHQRLLVLCVCAGWAAVGPVVAQVGESSIQTHARRAQEFLRQHQPEKAIPELQAVVDADPLNVDAQANLGVLLYFGKRWEPAAGHLRAALQRDSKLSKIRALLGLCEFQLVQAEAARADLVAALPDLTDKALRKQVGLVLIEIDTAAGDLPDASLVARDLLKIDPTDPEILYATYRIYSDLAGGSLLNLSLAAPGSGQMQQAIAHELLRVRDLSGAIRSFRRAIAAEPNLPGIHFELAEALRNSDDTAERPLAEQEYLAALAQNPREVQAAVRLGDLYADRNDLDRATKLYENALSLQADDADAELGLARIYAERGQADKALPLLLSVVSNDPSNTLAHFRLSALYRSMQRPDDAKRELAEYQKLKDLKDRLRQVYSTMKLQAPGAAEDTASTHDEVGARSTH